MSGKIMWWGYLHQNGTIQCKRWLGDHKDYTDDCEGNDFVQRVVRPFSADSREEALRYLKLALLPNMEVITLDVGDRVLCDSCGEDLSGSDLMGGLLFQSKAICPKCEPRWRSQIAKHGEERFVRGECPDGKTFANWVREDLR